jgi:hypothetical protein
VVSKRQANASMIRFINSYLTNTQHRRPKYCIYVRKNDV